MTPTTAEHATTTMSLPERYYHAADERCTELFAQAIPDARSAASRADLLAALAAELTYLAMLHPVAGISDPELPVILGQAARLARLLAATEAARGRAEVYGATGDSFEDIEGVADKLAEVAAADGTPADRAQIMVELYDLVAPHTVGDAAEIIIYVAESIAERWGGIQL